MAQVRRHVVHAALVIGLLTGPALAWADSSCWREPLLIGQNAAGLVNAYQLWERPRQGSPDARSADAVSPSNAIPSFYSKGGRGVVLRCAQVRTWINDRETVCSDKAGESDEGLWVPVIEGPVQDRVRLPLKGGGSAWLRFWPDHVLSPAPTADAAVAVASLARYGQPGQLAVARNLRVQAPLWSRPEAGGSALAWTGAQEAKALAFVRQAAPEQSPPRGAHWLAAGTLAEEGQWQIVSQVLRQQHTAQGEWWLVQQWLQPVESIDPGSVADGQAVLALDYTVRSPTLREGWVRHRDAQGRILAVITDGAGCD